MQHIYYTIYSFIVNIIVIGDCVFISPGSIHLYGRILKNYFILVLIKEYYDIIQDYAKINKFNVGFCAIPFVQIPRALSENSYIPLLILYNNVYTNIYIVLHLGNNNYVSFPNWLVFRSPCSKNSLQYSITSTGHPSKIYIYILINGVYFIENGYITFTPYVLFYIVLIDISSHD